MSTSVNLSKFSKSTAHLLWVVERVCNELRPLRYQPDLLSEAIITRSIIDAIHAVAQEQGEIGYSTVSRDCRTNLGVDSEGFKALICTHLTGGDQLIQAARSGCKITLDNPADVEAALKTLRLF